MKGQKLIFLMEGKGKNNTTPKILCMCQKKHAMDLLHEMLNKLTKTVKNKIHEWTFIHCSALNSVPPPKKDMSKS